MVEPPNPVNLPDVVRLFAVAPFKLIRPLLLKLVRLLNVAEPGTLIVLLLLRLLAPPPNVLVPRVFQVPVLLKVLTPVPDVATTALLGVPDRFCRVAELLIWIEPPVAAAAIAVAEPSTVPPFTLICVTPPALAVLMPLPPL